MGTGSFLAGGGLRFFAREVPATFNDSRFTALSTTVHELGWVTTFGNPSGSSPRQARRCSPMGDLPGGALEAAAAAWEPPGPENAE